MRKVWVVLDDGISLDAVFTTKTATKKYIEHKWPVGKFVVDKSTFVQYEIDEESLILAYFRWVNKGYEIEVPF